VTYEDCSETDVKCNLRNSNVEDVDGKNDVPKKQSDDSLLSLQHLLRTVPIDFLSRSTSPTISIDGNEISNKSFGRSTNEISLQHLLKTVPIPFDLLPRTTTESSNDSEISNNITVDSTISLQHLLKTVPIPLNLISEATESSIFDNETSASGNTTNEISLQHLLKTVPIPIDLILRTTTEFPSSSFKYEVTTIPTLSNTTADNNNIEDDSSEDDLSCIDEYEYQETTSSGEKLTSTTTESNIPDSEISLQHLLKTVPIPIDLILRTTTESFRYEVTTIPTLSTNTADNNISNEISLQHLLKTVPIPIDLILRTTTESPSSSSKYEVTTIPTLSTTAADNNIEDDCSEDDLSCIDEYEYQVTTSSGDKLTSTEIMKGKCD